MSMGVPLDEINRLRAERREESGGVRVYRENWQSLLVFLALDTQWIIIAGFAGAYYQGINYQALPIVEKRLGIKRKARRRLFADLQVMEQAAKPILNQVR